MKKIALTSLVAVLAVSGANAANVIDGNPLYKPAEGHFYSVTNLGTNSYDSKTLGLGEEFGYGISDKLSIAGFASLSETEAFENSDWNRLGASIAYRFYNDGAWMFDVNGGMSVAGLYTDGKTAENGWFKEDNTFYSWVAGVNGGYTSNLGTIAGHANYMYLNSEAFNWDEKADYEESHVLNLGVDAQIIVNNRWSLVGSADYFAHLGYGNWSKDLGIWDFMFGANYSISKTMFVGGYVEKVFDHREVENANRPWKAHEDWTVGAKFGIDF